MVYEDIFSDSIELTNERWSHIIKEHPEVSLYRERINAVLSGPDYVKRSSRDTEVLLYYKFFADILEGKYMLVAVWQ